MSQLGKYLLDREILSPAQIEEAQRSKAVYGGRLGTNLIKLGLMELEEVAAHLSDSCGVPLAPVEWLEEPEARAAQVLPMPLIRRYKLLPLRLEKTAIHVAMLDPNDLVQLDFIATAAARKVVPYVLPEIRLLYWLELHLGIDRHPRYVNLTSRSRQLGLLEEETASPEAPGPPRRTAPAGATTGGAPAAATAVDADEDTAPLPASSDAEDELILVDELMADAGAPRPSPGGVPVGPAPLPPRTPAEVAALEEALQAAGGPDEIAVLALRIARSYCRAAAFFIVRGGLVTSFRGDGDRLRERLEGIEVPILTESIFARPAAVLSPFRGAPPDDGIDGRLLRMIDRGGVQEVLIHPISIRGRVVNLLYADNGDDPLAETSVAALTALCGCVSRAYERIILAQKAEGS